MKKVIEIDLDRTQISYQTDIVYDNVNYWFGNVTQALRLNIMKQKKESCPVIVWVCGGAWKMMDKSFHAPEQVFLAENGFAVVSVEYQTSNSAQFPTPIENVKTAIRFLRKNAKRFGLDEKNIFIMGESAGGHIAALVGTTNKIKEFDRGEYLDYSSHVNGVCSWYGVIDLESIVNKDIETITMLGSYNSRDIGKTSVLSYINKDTVPFLIFHGNKDSVVDISQSDMLYDRLISNGCNAEYYVIEGANHADQYFVQEPIKEIIKDFFLKLVK